MAIYIFKNEFPRDGFAEVGADMRFTQGPPIRSWPWAHVLLYYQAIQINFQNDAGAVVGGGHFGLQIYDNSELGDAKRTVINWGVYDDTIGTPYAVFRSSIPIDYEHFLDVNNPVSFGFDFEYGEWIRFRVFKSPKQDWVANEIKPGTFQVPPYVDTDQQPDEVAYRCTLENVSRGTPPVAFNDVLIKSPADRPCFFGGAWLEPLGDSDLYRTWYFSPICEFRHFVFDGGQNTVVNFVCEYTQAGPHGDAINCNTTSHAGTPGFIRMEGRESGMTQSTAHGTIMAPPSGFWDAVPPNVTPNVTDTSPRIPTRRPWF